MDLESCRVLTLIETSFQSPRIGLSDEAACQSKTKAFRLVGFHSRIENARRDFQNPQDDLGQSEMPAAPNNNNPPYNLLREIRMPVQRGIPVSPV